jgi:hypothetical protein
MKEEVLSKRVMSVENASRSMLVDVADLIAVHAGGNAQKKHVLEMIIEMRHVATISDIAQAAGVHRNTVRKWGRDFQDALASLQGKGVSLEEVEQSGDM